MGFMWDRMSIGVENCPLSASKINPPLSKKYMFNYVDEVLISSLFMKLCISSSSSHFRFLTVFLDRCRSFAVWRIDLPSLCTDNRILRIVSTVSIPCSSLLLPIWLQHRRLLGVGQFYTPIWPIGGSLLHADLQARKPSIWRMKHSLAC